jgi:hypothetical protein
MSKGSEAVNALLRDAKATQAAIPSYCVLMEKR